MNWTAQSIENIVKDLSQENPLACKALYRVVALEFSTEVPTLAVSISERSVLSINLEFCRKHLRSETEVKAVLIHEFLHILLGHTEKYAFNTPLRNLATDAIINAMIHRIFGKEYSAFFERYYQGKGWQMLLQPATHQIKFNFDLSALHRKIYAGGISSEKLQEYLAYLEGCVRLEDIEGIVFIGNHDRAEAASLPKELAESLETIREELYDSKNPGKAQPPNIIFSSEGIRGKERLRRIWRKTTHAMLLSCLVPGDKVSNRIQEQSVSLPLLNSRDRRSMLNHLVTKGIPFAQHRVIGLKGKESVSIYLDTSLSMGEELKELVRLLQSFTLVFNIKIWAFSNKVLPARISPFAFSAYSTHGTDIACVFENIAKSRQSKFLIITDGEVGDISKRMLESVRGKKMAVLVSARGTGEKFQAAGIKWEQLKSLN